MKVVNKIKKFILNLLVLVFFVFAISMALLMLNRNKYGITQFDDTSLLLIRGEVSSDKYKKGDLVILKSKLLTSYDIGDDIFVYQLDRTGIVNIDLGELSEVNTETEEIAFKNGSVYSKKYVIGETEKVYPKIGAYLSVIQSRWGFLFSILVPSFFIFLYQLYALIVEIKYGNEDEINKNTLLNN